MEILIMKITIIENTLMSFFFPRRTNISLTIKGKKGEMHEARAPLQGKCKKRFISKETK